MLAGDYSHSGACPPVAHTNVHFAVVQPDAVQATLTLRRTVSESVMQGARD